MQKDLARDTLFLGFRELLLFEIGHSAASWVHNTEHLLTHAVFERRRCAAFLLRRLSERLDCVGLSWWESWYVGHGRSLEDLVSARELFWWRLMIRFARRICAAPY